MPRPSQTATTVTSRAFLRREIYRLRTVVSGYETTATLIREAVRHYLANPFYTLPATA